MAEEKKAIWLGGIAGHFLTPEEQEQYKAIAMLGQKYSDFQNGPYRGEFNQKAAMTYGEIQAILLDVSALFKRAEGPVSREPDSDFYRFDNRAPI